jgi:predicted transcriptional regulator
VRNICRLEGGLQPCRPPLGFHLARVYSQRKEQDTPTAAQDAPSARLMVPWGVPQAVARLYGYLLLGAEPVSLDRIAADLEVSKSSASVAARLLEKYTLVRRHGERGSKRVLYDASDNYEGMLSGQNRLLEASAELLSGRDVVKAFAKDGWQIARRRGVI